MNAILRATEYIIAAVSLIVVVFGLFCWALVILATWMKPEDGEE